MSLFYDRGRLAMGPKERPFDLFDFARKTPTPFYIYDLDSLGVRIKVLKESLGSSPRVSIHFAVKTNNQPKLLQYVQRNGLGADVVSGGELQASLDAGFRPQEIIFSGVGKSEREIDLALDFSIKQINVESPQELERIGQLARRKGTTAKVAFRLNPDVNPQTHPYITTGFRENKFGMDESFMPELEKILLRYPESLRFVGVTQHIGSQLLDLNAFKEAVQKTSRVFEELRQKGHPLETLDLGGGVGIHYTTEDETQELELLKEYGNIAKSSAERLGCEVLLEPGRALVGRAGALVAQVEYTKITGAKNFAILNTGMHHLLRPALYQAHHRILPLDEKEQGNLKVFDVVGPICESSDTLGKDRPFYDLEQGDLLAIADCGAYGRVMASHYNLHDLPAEYVLQNGELL